MKKILILILVLTLVLAQGGGGRGGGGGGRGGRSSSRKKVFIPPKSGCSESECPDLRNQCDKKCEQSIQDDLEYRQTCIEQCKVQYGQKYESNWYWFFIIGGIFFGVCYQNGLKEKGAKFIKDHKQRIKNYECSTVDLQNRFQYIKNRLRRISFIQNGQVYETDNFKITGSPHKQRCLFKINLKSKDHFGSWTAQGLIGYSDQGCQIWLSKDYNNKRAAGQTGKWSTIIYQGKIDEQTLNIEGVWFFTGFEKDSLYSGIWSSRSIKQE